MLGLWYHSSCYRRRPLSNDLRTQQMNDLHFVTVAAALARILEIYVESGLDPFHVL